MAGRSSLLARFGAAATVAAALVVSSAALAQKPRADLPNKLEAPPAPPAKLPLVPSDRGKGLDFLFGALKAAPDDDSARHVEARIWALWTQTTSDTTALLMALALSLCAAPLSAQKPAPAKKGGFDATACYGCHEPIKGLHGGSKHGGGKKNNKRPGKMARKAFKRR